MERQAIILVWGESKKSNEEGMPERKSEHCLITSFIVNLYCDIFDDICSFIIFFILSYHIGLGSARKKRAKNA